MFNKSTCQKCKTNIVHKTHRNTTMNCVEMLNHQNLFEIIKTQIISHPTKYLKPYSHLSQFKIKTQSIKLT